MARPRKNAAVESTTTSSSPSADAPAAVAAPIERTSAARNGIQDITGGDPAGTPARKFDAKDYDWDNNPKSGLQEAKPPVEGGTDDGAGDVDAPLPGEDPDGAGAPAGEKAPTNTTGAAADAALATSEPKITDDLIKQAEALGLPAAVARAFETPEALTKYLASKKPSDASQAPVDADQEFKFNADAFKEYPPEVQAVLSGLAGHVKKQGEQLSALRSELTQRASSVELDLMDKAIEAIGDEKAFGKGPTSGMKDGQTTASRAKLIQAAQVLIAGREAIGQPPLSMEQAFAKAYRLEFEDRVAVRTNASVAGKVRARVAQVMGRSEPNPDSVARGGTMTPEQRAVQAGRDLLAKRGHNTSAQHNSMVPADRESIW